MALANAILFQRKSSIFIVSAWICAETSITVYGRKLPVTSPKEFSNFYFL